MSDPSNTVRLHRVLRAPAERVYRAFVDPGAWQRWLPPYGYVGEVHEHHAKVGGAYRMTFTNFAAGAGHTFGGTYLELTPHKRIRYTSRFDSPDLPGEMTTTIDLDEFSCGTEISIVQQGIPEPIPAKSCYLGWQESLLQLARLVEAGPPHESPDGEQA
ncbi:hypothetical protein Pla175_09810 [Pirellulimonas nuda]|uniref:Activator of Hsp90 ATPase homologue 1/2-like C-terminal domain-containing protein n=1 Tax=Pirellulimonas nuda TaxID=2528009 RepID=A0A518D803_9BACT|nr:SRPBCC family protein [Pirellulimonas nuda]QDU87616.1 hypothetical protein Pla175_09810 [Pirellulimonas nuda]